MSRSSAARIEEELVLTVSELIEQERGPWQPPPL